MACWMSPGRALGKEAHGQMEHVPHVMGVGGHFKLSPDAQQPRRIGGRHGNLDAGKQKEHGKEIGVPVAVLGRQHIVNEELLQQGNHHTHQGGNQAGEAHKDQCGRASLQPVPDEGPDGDGMPRGGKARRLLEGQAHIGVMGGKLFPGHPHPALGRIVEGHVPGPHAGDDQEMAVFPEGDAGKGRRFFQDGLGGITEALGGQTVFFDRLDDVKGIGPIPGYPAVPAELLQGKPPLVMGQHHSQGGRAALQLLHLDDAPFGQALEERWLNEGAVGVDLADMDVLFQKGVHQSEEILPQQWLSPGQIDLGHAAVGELSDDVQTF